ncbi:nitrate regulatory gene2 protein-like [Hibiscus syriacus]|uniref:nitrate regulatory gene2 protein-like n=1 Tax=Hibiscus syriacus TaxID=106335 RepID=UPI00192235F5|nr:nitrate regulatory gene2 protein-like [Hibiscus syriacus]
MGCVTSKLDQLPAVCLCRDRCNFLQDALQQSYALADAHLAYMQSLKTLGPALQHFFDQCLKSSSGDDSAVSIELPPKILSPLSSPDNSFSSSNSDSHIQFDTDSEEEESGEDFSKCSNEIHISYLNQGFLTSYPMSNHDYHASTNQSIEISGSGWKTPPPPAPRSAAWDYLNFFDEIYERHELPYFSSKPVKGERADDYLEAHVLNQIHGDEKSTADYTEEKRENPSREAVPVKNRDAEADKVQNKVVTDEPKNQSGKQSVSEVIKELQVLFEKASESGNEVLDLLDTGKFRYHHKKYFYQGPAKMFHMVTSNSSEKESSLPKEKIDSMDNDEVLSSQNLSSTLRKLCIWEKKLYDDVKAEEKLRIIHSKKHSQMKSMDQKGADAHLVDSTRASIRALSTKMRVAVQVIDNIAITINKLMDEELRPQINELIHRLFGMWKVMLECHSCQYQKVMEAKCLDIITMNENLSDTHLKVAMKLKLELQNWILSFSSWIEAQRGYVKALNGWLHRCLLYEPEEIAADGVSSFSSSGCGVPPVFGILNQWSEVMDKVSEKEVAEAMHGFWKSINQMLEHYNSKLQQRIIADKDMERKLKDLEKEEQKMQARVKKMALWESKESAVVPPRNTSDASASLQYGLKQIFMTMEKLASQSRQVYEELPQCIEKCKAKATQDNA